MSAERLSGHKASRFPENFILIDIFLNTDSCPCQECPTPPEVPRGRIRPPFLEDDNESASVGAADGALGSEGFDGLLASRLPVVRQRLVIVHPSSIKPGWTSNTDDG